MNLYLFFVLLYKVSMLMQRLVSNLKIPNRQTQSVSMLFKHYIENLIKKQESCLFCFWVKIKPRRKKVVWWPFLKLTAAMILFSRYYNINFGDFFFFFFFFFWHLFLLQMCNIMTKQIKLLWKYLMPKKIFWLCIRSNGLQSL